MSAQSNLSSKLKELPAKPGVYRFFNNEKKIIYVGKAKELKKRVSQYFRKNITDQKTAALMSHVIDFEITITDNENQALLLECNLIKEHHPKYNILLRDDKSYPYLFLSTHDDFPRLDYCRQQTKSRQGRYFGPYPNAGSVRDNLALIQKLFKLRQCSDSFFQSRSRPCLQYQIDRCTAPCVQFVSKEDYAAQVKDAIDFLEGKSKAVIKSLDNKMTIASHERNYEKAAQIRDILFRLRKLQEQQFVMDIKGNRDIVGVIENHGCIAIAIISIRHGLMLGHKTFFIPLPENTQIPDALSAFISQYYLNPARKSQVIDKIVLNHPLNDRLWIQNALRENQASASLTTAFHIIIQNPADKPRSRKAKAEIQLLNMALENADHELQRHQSEKNLFAQKIEALQKVLHFSNRPERMECFDISHTMGESTKASCVVFGMDGPIKKMYRQFNIDNITPGDDYAAMKQVLTRRYTKLKKDNSALPDLIIVDGGKGQLKIAASVLESLQISGVTLMGVAKGVTRKAGVEKLWVWGRDSEIALKQTDLARHLIQQIRDEAHRFAITAHRKALQKNIRNRTVRKDNH